MCWMQCIMLEVLVSKSLEGNFVSLLGGSYKGRAYDRIRRLSIHGEDEGMMNMQHVRSLTVFQSEGHKLLDRLGEFTLLSVLDLQDCKGLEDKHLKDICRMYLLKYLCLKGTDISVMPEKVGELEHLQMLDVRDTYLCRLPETVKKLEKLERMLFSCVWKPPQGLRKMKALREVMSMVLEDDVCVAQEIGELEQLQRLTISVDCDGPNGKEVLKELALSLSKIYSLRFLRIDAISLNFLPSLPRLLRFLRIDGGIDELPSWVSSLTYLIEFHMSWARLDDDQIFSVLCKCPNLKTIVLERDFYISEELVARSTFVFPELRNLDVPSDSEHPKVIRFEEGSMTKLEKLSVNFSSWSEKSIVGIEHLPNLKELHLTGKKDNPVLSTSLEDLKVVRDGLPESKQFKVLVKYI